MISLNNLIERASFLFGDDKDIPTPNKLCLFKLSEKYKDRKNCPFYSDYILGKIKETNGTICLEYEESKKRSGYCRSPKKFTSTYNKDFFEFWIYIEDINKLVERMKNGN